MSVENKRITNIKEHFYKYREALISLIDSIDLDVLEKIITTLITAFKNNNTIYVCGNGGSAATSSHFQVDFGFFVRYFSNRRIRIRSLTDNIPMITAIGNDNSYEDIFVEQMRDNFQKGDVLIAISASGNSMNIVKAAEYANQLGGISIALVGFKGGKLKQTAKICLHTPNPEKEYGPIEDLHMILNHLIVTYLSKDDEFMSLSK